MKKLMLGLVGLLFSTTLWANNMVAADSSKPLDGLWEVKYDASNTPSAHIRITTQENGKIVGVIETAYARPTKDHPTGQVAPDNELCTKCEGDNKNRPLKGLTVLWDIKPVKDNNHQWKGGHLVNAEDGKQYDNFTMTLSPDNHKLDFEVHVMIFSGSSTWTRIAK